VNTTDRDHPIHSAEVDAAIRGTLLKRGIKEQELEDALQEVKTGVVIALQKEKAAKVATSEPVDETLARVKALACGTAVKVAADAVREVVSERAREKKGRAPLETHALPQERQGEDAMIARLDQQRVLAAVQKAAAAGEITTEYIETAERQHTDDEPLAQIAADQKQPYSKMYNAQRKEQRRLRSAFMVAGGFTFAVALFWIGREMKVRYGVDNNGTEANIGNQAEPLAMHDSAERRANELRKQAMDKCAASDWNGCLDDLNAAWTIDPDRANAPEELIARNQARQGLVLELQQAKPHGRPLPPPPKK
jgi:hypothetical protein